MQWQGVTFVTLVFVGGLVHGLGGEVLAQTGTISGMVKFTGTPPPPKKIPVTKDTAKCGEEKPSEELIVGKGGGLRNAVVSLVGVTTQPWTPAKNPVVDQKTCQFIPHVVIVPSGGSLDILNSDGILHNIHTYSTKNPTINKAQPGFKKKMTERFAQPEIVKVTCDAHPWMIGWIVVTEHPYYAVTDDRGSFTLANVPPGTYKLKVWHETLGEVTKDVTIKAGEEAKVTVELAKK
ncbi:MAG: carboxypeptidase regulatory-like domain-containing protein [candidate division NC10 bacterium]|nr:carboxypeptidase regulatory-like domain-containing protein [candidate division NC10 bacterium]